MKDHFYRIARRIDQITVTEMIHDRIIGVIPQVMRHNRWPLCGLARKDRAL
jgi:hypothetical protein